MKTEETRALIERYYKALTHGDRDDLRSCLSDDVVWQLPVTAGANGAGGSDADGVVRGREAVEAELGGRTIKDAVANSEQYA